MEVSNGLKMSTEDYDACEKLFCGSWMMSKDINFESFLEASGELNFIKMHAFSMIYLVMHNKFSNCFVWVSPSKLELKFYFLA